MRSGSVQRATCRSEVLAHAGNSATAAYEGAMSEYLFIDGGCLRSAVRKICADIFGDEGAYEPHVQSLAAGSYAKVFYYDAVSGKAHNEAQAAYEARVQPEHERFAKIQSLDRVHVQLGQIVGKDKRQKGVDVRLAVDMMSHAFRGNISRATLFAGDADFVPLIKALVNHGLHVTLWHPPQANAELRGAADSARPFDFQSHHSCFTADGEQSAFRVAGSGGGGGDASLWGLTRLVTINDHYCAAQWRNDQLTAWQSADAKSWHRIDFAAPGESLRRALVAFDAIYEWGFSTVGEDWVET